MLYKLLHIVLRIVLLVQVYFIQVLNIKLGWVVIVYASPRKKRYQKINKLAL